MNEENRIIALLEANNALLKQIADMEIKRQRDEKIAGIIQIIAILLPYILLSIAGLLAWQWLNHYLEVMNANIDALKANFDALREFLQKFVPDIGAVGSSLQETWRTVTSWN